MSTTGRGKGHSQVCQQDKVDCFAFGIYGKCKACRETVFDKPCPFYKTYAQVRTEREATMTRLQGLKRYDLIEKYLQQPDDRMASEGV